MHLTQTMLLNSCGLGLYERITDEASLLELEHRGGPTAFFIMTKHIVATTAKASQAMVQRVQRVKLSGFSNEDQSLFSHSHQYCGSIVILQQASR
jgi:hypothetical protein